VVRLFWLIFVAAGACGGQSMAGKADLAGTCPDDLPSGCAQVPSWSAMVQAIVANRCQVCHASDGDAPKVPLTTYAEVSGRRVASLTQITSCEMPPGDDPSLPAPVVLSTDERQALLTWLNCGAPNN
jgi:hypothetical protein